MRPSLLVLSILLHGTAIGAVVGFGAYAGEAGAPPPARIEIESTQAAVATSPPVTPPPVEAVTVEADPDEPDVVVFDEVEPVLVPPPVDRDLPADRLPSQALARLRPSPPRSEAQAEVAPATELAAAGDAEPQPSSPSAPPQEFVEAQRADNAPPRYPDRERRLRHEGEVVLAVSVTEQGEVVDVVVRLASRYDALNRAAVRAARGWRFTPALEHGRPVPSVTEIVVEFRLEDA